MIQGAETDTLSAFSFVSGDLIRCDVYLDDTRDLTVTKSDVVIDNAPPTVASCVVTPSSGATVSTPLSVSASGLSDIDVGDVPFLSSTFRWQELLGASWSDIPGSVGSTRGSCDDMNLPPADPLSVYDCDVGTRIRAVCTPNDLAGTGGDLPSAVVEIGR